MDLNQHAREIIKNNRYLTLATSDENVPWASPVFYCVNDRYDFYFVSEKGTLHVQNAGKNSKVAVAIFDSHQKEGEGTGIQFSGIISEIPEADFPQALTTYHTTFIELTPEKLSGASPYRMYKIVPDKIFILDPQSKADKRVEVKLV